MPKGVPNKRYSPEFKQLVVETMRNEHMSVNAVMQEFGINDHKIIERWERIYLEEGPEGLSIERRGRGRTGVRKLPKEVEADMISDHPVLSMVTTMLEKTFDTIPNNTNLILHSDQGWQYQHKHYQTMLIKKGIRQSMSRKGNCLDNAVMENFFGLLKSALLYLQEFESMEHFKMELIECLDYYNNRRIKAKRKGLPPAIHRQQALSAA